MSYLMDLHQHYKQVRNRINGIKPVEIVFEPPAPEPELEPEPPPAPEVVWVDPLPNVAACIEVKRKILDILEEHNMSWKEAMSRTRTPRHLAVRTQVYLMLKERGWSYPRIGRLCGKRDHTTVLHSVRLYEQKLAQTGESQ